MNKEELQKLLFDLDPVISAEPDSDYEYGEAGSIKIPTARMVSLREVLIEVGTWENAEQQYPELRRILDEWPELIKPIE